MYKMEPNLTDLPPDVVQKILKDFTFDEIEKICTTSKSMDFHCQDGMFWRSKILADFRVNKNQITHIPLDGMRQYYAYLLASKLGDDIRRIQQNYDIRERN